MKPRERSIKKDLSRVCPASAANLESVIFWTSLKIGIDERIGDSALLQKYSGTKGRWPGPIAQSLPGPQERGTGGTPGVVFGRRDRGHPPTSLLIHSARCKTLVKWLERYSDCSLDMGSRNPAIWTRSFASRRKILAVSTRDFGRRCTVFNKRESRRTEIPGQTEMRRHSDSLRAATCEVTVAPIVAFRR